LKVDGLENILDHKCHVTEAEVDLVPKNDPVLRFAVHSVPKEQLEFCITPIVVSDLGLVASELAPCGTVYNGGAINNVSVALIVLESHGICTDVK
jgi:hypothetical protein